jgi:hypothetical protein
MSSRRVAGGLTDGIIGLIRRLREAEGWCFKVRQNRFGASYANVMATLALFIALGGGAYAAAALPRNSVGSKQLKKNAVVRAKIKKNAVNGAKVASNSLTGADVNEATLAKVPSAALADSATNATNATNANHANAAAALDKASYKTAAATAPAGSGNSATAACDAGQHVTGGGVKVDDPLNAFVVDAYPDAANTAWTARVGNAGAAAVGFTVYAICTSVSTTG